MKLFRNIDWKWLIIGILVAYVVIPLVLGKLTGGRKTTASTARPIA